MSTPLLNDISLWLQRYDVAIKIVSALAAPGGIWFWFDRYRNRIRITVREFNLSTLGSPARAISFEVENISTNLTSLEPTFVMTGYSPERDKQTYTFVVNGEDRQLLPHVTKPVLGIHNDHQNRSMLFLWFMTFTLRLTKGGSVRLRFRNSEFARVGFLRFHWERLQFVCF